MKTRTDGLSAKVVMGLDDDEKAIFQRLVDQLRDRRAKNELRRAYYDGHNTLKDLGIAVPPQLRSLEVVVG